MKKAGLLNNFNPLQFMKTVNTDAPLNGNGSYFSKWFNKEIQNLGSFDTALFELYIKADGSNREKLIAAFPTYFLPKELDVDIKDSPEDVNFLPPTVVYDCPGCGQTTDYRGTGVCPSCETKGIWVDPAGGIHTDDEDPSAMYE